MLNTFDKVKLECELQGYKLVGEPGNYGVHLIPFKNWSSLYVLVRTASLEEIQTIIHSDTLPKYGVYEDVLVRLDYASGWKGSKRDVCEWVAGKITKIMIKSTHPTLEYRYYVKYHNRKTGVHGRYDSGGKNIAPKSENYIKHLNGDLDVMYQLLPDGFFDSIKRLEYEQLKLAVESHDQRNQAQVQFYIQKLEKSLEYFKDNYLLKSRLSNQLHNLQHSEKQFFFN